jgi:hypothetical protein
VAERVGFEPTIGYQPIHTFQACAFDRSAISPMAASISTRVAYLGFALADFAAEPAMYLRTSCPVFESRQIAQTGAGCIRV